MLDIASDANASHTAGLELTNASFITSSLGGTVELAVIETYHYRRLVWINLISVVILSR